MTGNDSWVDRTQTPIISFIVWQIYQRTKNRSLLELAYPVLAAQQCLDPPGARRQRQRHSGVRLVAMSGRASISGTKLAAKDEVLHGQFADP